jgi:hypothetical protein
MIPMRNQSQDECTPVSERTFGLPNHPAAAVWPTTAGAIANDATDTDR